MTKKQLVKQKCPIYMSGKHHFGWDFNQIIMIKNGCDAVGYPSCKCGAIDDRKHEKERIR